MSQAAICPCGTPTFPVVPNNPAGRSIITYRVADFVSLRHALLHSLDGESQLAGNWRPGADGDLAVQLIEWWAYLGDILSVYNERIAHQAYLRTADQPDRLHALIALLGYRPRPGIGAQGLVAALVSGGMPFTLPRGFKIQSKPGPGKPPQIFELDADTAVKTPDAVPFDPPPFPHDLTQDQRLLLRGPVSRLKRGTPVVVVAKNWAGDDGSAEVRKVADMWSEKDPRGRVNTRLELESELFVTGEPSTYRMLVGGQPAYLWHYNETDPITSVQVPPAASDTKKIHLQGVVRQIQVGNVVLLTEPKSGDAAILYVTSYSERLWYANGAKSSPETAPATGPIPVLHTEIEVKGSLDPTTWNGYKGRAAMLYGWRDAGELIPDPAPIVRADTFTDDRLTVEAVRPATFPAGSGALGLRMLIEDAVGAGALTTGTPLAAGPSFLELKKPTNMAQSLKPPLRGLLNLLPISRGETVIGEVLGDGDATKSAQEFVLKKSPLTYLPDPTSVSGNPYRSTLRVWVDGTEWQEVASFYGQPVSAQVFTTREDVATVTHIQFGDGVNAARLATGRGNVVASYRVGSGAANPPDGALRVLVKPYPGLKAIRNPIGVWGGADPDPPEQIRGFAPRSVLIFGRAVSARDYETIAGQTPGVARARAYWSWDGAQQRNTVKLYVGDDVGAVTAATQALSGASDSNRPLSIRAAIPISDPLLTISVALTPGFRLEDVQTGARSAFFNSGTGFFSLANMGIGRSIFKSELITVCMQVPGVAAIHTIDFSTQSQPIGGVRWDPGEGAYFVPSPNNFSLGLSAT